MSLLLSKGFLIGTLATLGEGAASYGGYVVYTHVIKGNTSVDTNSTVLTNSCTKKSTRSLLSLLSSDDKDNNSCTQTLPKPSVDAQSTTSQDTTGKNSSDQGQTQTPASSGADVQTGKGSQPQPPAPPVQGGSSQDAGVHGQAGASSPTGTDATQKGDSQKPSSSIDNTQNQGTPVSQPPSSPNPTTTDGPQQKP